MYEGRMINVPGCTRDSLCSKCHGLCGDFRGKIRLVGRLTTDFRLEDGTVIEKEVVEKYFNGKFFKHKERLCMSEEK
jgi:hypothetical protein